jgi:RNA polymerase sigma-70 factor (ECF subfamily)
MMLAYPKAATVEARAEALDLDAVYRAHAKQVSRWVAHLAGPGLDVEDLVHEVFLVVRAQLAEFRGDARITTWLYRITERIVRDARRKERVRSFLRRTRRDDVEHALTAQGPTPAEALERQQARASVYAVLDRLSDKQRTMLVLFELEGLSGEQISELTGIKLPTVWVNLHRARAQFLAEMKSRKEGNA